LFSCQLESGHAEVENFGDISFPPVTALSPYMRFGCISTRLVYHTLTKLQKKVCRKKDCTTLDLLGKIRRQSELFGELGGSFFFDLLRLCECVTNDKTPRFLYCFDIYISDF
jgi:hypothetical protein